MALLLSLRGDRKGKRAEPTRGWLRSTLKEHDSYGKEIKAQSDKIAKMKSDNADVHDVKQQVSWFRS
jgi:hypothetical protein